MSAGTTGPLRVSLCHVEVGGCERGGLGAAMRVKTTSGLPSGSSACCWLGKRIDRSRLALYASDALMAVAAARGAAASRPCAIAALAATHSAAGAAAVATTHSTTTLTTSIAPTLAAAAVAAARAATLAAAALAAAVPAARAAAHAAAD